MNIIRPIGKYLFLLGALNVWFAASAQVATPSCSASFDILDGSGLAIASISQSGEELTICVEQTLTFVSTSAPSSGSTIADGQWNFGGIVISNLNDQPFQFGQDMTLNVSINISDDQGCQGFASVTITVLGDPGFEFDLEEPSCFGLCNGSLLGTYLSDNASYYTHTWYRQGFDVGSGDLTASACEGSYNVVVTDSEGCTDLDIPFILNEPPAIEMSITPPGPVSMCPGDIPLSLTATHLNAATPLQNIAWSWPASVTVPNALITAFIPTSNNLNQTLDINIVDANGCAGSASIYLGARNASLFGTVEIDGAPCEDCVVEFYKMSEAGAWSPITAISTMASGLYELNLVPGLTDCLLRMKAPDADYPNLPAYYYPATHNWQNATIITTGCDIASEKNFSLSSPPQLSGSTTIEGGVYQQTSGKTASEDPIPGVDVVVEKVPPGNAMTVVTTDVDGRFTFEFMEETLGDTVITFYVDIPGLPMASTYLFSISANDVLFENVDFCVDLDTVEINACNLLSVSQLGHSEELNLSVFPNPASDVVQFKVRGSKAVIAEVILIDMTGRAVRHLMPDASDFELNVNGLSEGIYTATVRLSDGKVLSERLMVGR